MIPTSSFSSSSSSTSAASAIVRVDKATSDFLIGPDWTLNINICDAINTNPGMAKDVVKAVKKRLQHKNPKVQMLSLTLLETMVKNCGDYVHFQITERNILQDMVKIVKKKIDMHVRDKILVLLNSWQEAFGGPGGKYPQYYWAYEELRRCGVEFPQRSAEAAPMFTAAVTHPPMRHTQAGYGMPSNSSRRLDEAMASEVESLSFSNINSMRDVLDLLSDMLQAVNPNDRAAVKDEVIIDLVEQCRANQKKLMHMLTTTGDEELLGQGLELNDSMQSVLAKHDAIASGSPLPTQLTNFSPRSAEVPSQVGESSPPPTAIPSAPVVPESKQHVGEEKDDDDDDDFAQLARRHSKMQSPTSQDTSLGGSILNSNGTASSTSPSATSSNALALALALPDPPPPVKTSNDQDMIDFLSLTLSTTATSPRATTPQIPTQPIHQQPHVSPPTQGYPYPPHTHPTNQGQVQVPSNTYVVPWAQPEPQPQPHSQPQQSHPQSQPQQLQPQSQPHGQSQQLQPHTQHHPQSQPQQFQPHSRPNPQLSYGYPPPPWAGTPGYYNNPNPNPYAFSTPRANVPAYYSSPLQGGRPLQQLNSFPTRGINGQAVNGVSRVGPTPTGGGAPAGGPKPFVPSYRLFEDLNVLGNGDGRSGGLSGASGQSMVGGRK